MRSNLKWLDAGVLLYCVCLFVFNSIKTSPIPFPLIQNLFFGVWGKVF